MRSLFIVIIFHSLLLSAQMIEVHGHRGMRGKWKENTLVAFQHAIDAQVDVIELDLSITKDEVVVVHHNPDLVSGTLIATLTWEEVKKCDPTIVTLEEVITFVKKHPRIRLNCDIKRDPFHPEKTLAPTLFATRIVEVVKGCDFSDRIYYTSFDPAILAALRKLSPEAILGFIYDQKTLDEIKRRGHGEDFLVLMARKLKLAMLIPEQSIVKKEDVEKFHALGFRVVTWTVNNPKRWMQLFDLQVDGVITDDPAILFDMLLEK